jgi:hypothetical protein
VLPFAYEPWQQISMLGQFDLQLAFAGSRLVRKDVQDERRTVDDLHVEFLFKRALLSGGKLIIGDEQGVVERPLHLLELLQFASTNVVRARGGTKPLHLDACHYGSGSLGEARKLRK